MGLDIIVFFRFNSLKGFWTMAVYPFYLWMCFCPYFYHQFYFGTYKYFPHPYTYSWNFAWLFFFSSITWIAQWARRVVHLKYIACMLFFVLNFWTSVLGGLFLPSVLNVICCSFYGNLHFPHLRMAYDDTSPWLEILNVFNLIWTLISQSSTLKLENSCYFIYNNCT